MPPTAPVLIRGRYLWKGNQRFLVRGVVYQDHERVPFTLPNRDLLRDDRLAQLRHDVGLFKELGVNTVYVYWIDYTSDHTQAMKVLEEAGIHVLLSLSSPQHCINRMNPQGSYKPDTLAAFFRTVDAMAGFSNTLGVLVADHLINNTHSETCAPVVAAVIRDLKKYMDLKFRATGQRVLPIGFGGAEYKYDRQVLEYLAGHDDRSNVDFWTCTGYNWPTIFNTGTDGYDNHITKFRDIDIPIFFSEYGNNKKSPRTFDETTLLYSPKMTGVFSGGCAYELWQGSNVYGLVHMQHKGADSRMRTTPGQVAETRHSDLGTLSIFEDFVNYKARLASSVDVPACTDDSLAEKQRIAEEPPGLPPGGLAIEGLIPESCLDWTDVEAHITVA